MLGLDFVYKLAAFHSAGFRDLTVRARSAEAGARRAATYEARSAATEPPPGHALLVNVTPLGMSGSDAEALAFSAEHVAAPRTVCDVVALLAETPLIRQARSADIPVITGAGVLALQAARRFARYTAVMPTVDQVRRASAFSRE